MRRFESVLLYSILSRLARWAGVAVVARDLAGSDASIITNFITLGRPQLICTAGGYPCAGK